MAPAAASDALSTPAPLLRSTLISTKSDAPPMPVALSSVMSSPVTSMEVLPSASRMRAGDTRRTLPSVEWMWPASMSPANSVAVIVPLVVRKICSTSLSGCLPAQSTSVLMMKSIVVFAAPSSSTVAP